MPFYVKLNYDKWDLTQIDRPKANQVGSWSFQLIGFGTKRTTITFHDCKFFDALTAAKGMCGPRSYEAVYVLANLNQAEPAPRV